MSQPFPPVVGRNWAPLLEGEVAERSRAAFGEIAAALRRPPPVWSPPEASDSERAVVEATLACGRAGLAVFFASLARVGPNGDEAQVASRLLGDAVRVVAEAPMSASLFSGFTGVAWAAHYVSRATRSATGASVGSNDAEDACSGIDDALANYLARRPWRAHYDLGSGLAGLGLYALERLPRRRARECAKRVVLRLDELALETPEGIAWHTPRELLGERERERYPEGYLNLGVAHGVPGVAVVLARCLASGIETRRARRLLSGAVDWLLAERGPEPGRRMPYAVAPGLPRHPGRTAWCSGDPGVAAALFLAGRLMGERSWAAEGIRMALDVAALAPDSCGVVDAGLCHGAMGLAHIFHRLHRASDEPRLADAARHWFEYGLALRHPGRGVAGFTAAMPDEAGGKGWADPGFMQGAAGIGLALLAATSEAEPDWDAPLLLSAATAET